jgi:hypothetical protein
MELVGYLWLFIWLGYVLIIIVQLAKKFREFYGSTSFKTCSQQPVTSRCSKSNEFSSQVSIIYL